MEIFKISYEDGLNNVNDLNSPFAVFLFGNVKGSSTLYAATTRAKDRNESGRIGLPGGKVDTGEMPIEAVKREAREEGWNASEPIEGPIHKDVVDGKIVWWFKTSNLEKLETYKEQNRILNIEATLEQLLKSGYGNSFLADFQ